MVWGRNVPDSPGQPNLPQAVQAQTQPNYMGSPINLPASVNQPGLQTIYVQTQAPLFTDKIIRKFSGYMHEDGQKFLREFVVSNSFGNLSRTTGLP